MGKSVTLDIIREVAKQEGVAVKEVEQIVSFQSQYLRHVMTNSGFEGLRLPYVGRFLASPKAIQYINNKPLRDALSGKRPKQD